jgi:hypothetical protein
MMKNALFALLVGVCLTGCITPKLITPNTQDSAAPGDTIVQLRGANDRSRCSRHVQVVPPAVGAMRPFHSIASVSATCSPGTPSVCEQHLRERACELEGDAVILSDKVEQPAPTTGSTRALVARAGQVVRWLDATQ